MSSKNVYKRKTTSRENPTNSPVTREVSPEVPVVCGGKDFWRRNVLSLECKTEGVADSDSSGPVGMRLVNATEQEADCFTNVTLQLWSSCTQDETVLSDEQHEWWWFLQNEKYCSEISWQSLAS